MKTEQIHRLFLNVGHTLDHLCMLIFATAAALALNTEWSLSYAELIPYATPGFVAFGLFALPAGWLADRWSREGLMVIFFIGLGAASVACAFAQTPMQIGIGLFCLGFFAAIYHPVGIGLLLSTPGKTGMRVAINGVWGNMGVAVAALLTGYLIDSQGWRFAFWLPGVFSIATGILYWQMIVRQPVAINNKETKEARSSNNPTLEFDQHLFKQVILVVMLTTALGGLVFQSTTFALPKVLDERVTSVTTSATLIGWIAFFVFAMGSMGQLIVGYLVDKYSPRPVFMGVALLQVIFFAGMLPANGWLAIIMATGFMLAAFGQIPINDVLVGRVARSEWRSRILALRYTITITVMASSIPLIAWIHATRGFNALFLLLCLTAVLIFMCTITLPRFTTATPIKATA
ncbi:MAG: MFS transporter [Granulosicoccus sp.]|nr:MFS transporter [Granulosicoccus sp.]